MAIRSIQWRLVSIFIFIAIFLIIPVAIFLNREVEKQNYTEFKEAIERGFSNWQITEDFEIDEMLSYLSVNEGRNAIIQFAILDAHRSYSVVDKEDLEVVYSSDRYYSLGMINGNADSFINEILISNNFIDAMGDSGVGKGGALVSVNGRKYFDYARSVTLKNGEYILYFRYDNEAWKDTIESFNKILFFALLVSVTVSIFVGYLLSKTITSPIGRIMNRAKRLAAGEFDIMLEVDSDDEIGQLTRAFNHMARNLKNTLTEIASEKNKIETIFNYMTDGIIAFNIKGELIHINPAALKMLTLEKFNMTLDEFAHKFNIDVRMEEMIYLEDYTNRSERFVLDNTVFNIYFAMFTDENRKPEGLIGVIHDITDQERLDNMRKEFVANVSHEIRTPLTSIKSYTEALLDGDLENWETAISFLKVINSEADRMTRLVKDLLQLSSFDGNRMIWQKDDVNVVELVKGIVSNLQFEAREKNHLLQCHVIGDIPGIRGDKGRLEQVISNVITNSVRYTPEKGTISAYIGKTYSEVYVKVTDNGVGIPKEDLPRIFERFYRVDKARSREMGGTGLGLSIAREIIEAHNGNITISSEIGEGTEVVIKLPFRK